MSTYITTMQSLVSNLTNLKARYRCLRLVGSGGTDISLDLSAGGWRAYLWLCTWAL